MPYALRYATGQQRINLSTINLKPHCNVYTQDTLNLNQYSNASAQPSPAQPTIYLKPNSHTET